MQTLAVVGNEPPELVTRGDVRALEEVSMFDDDPRWETAASATTTLAISTDAIENLFTCGRNTLATRSHNAVLVGQSEPDVPGRGSRGLHVVAEAERERSPPPVLREHARGIAWRRRVLVLRYAHHGRRGRNWRRANRPQARLRRRRFELISRRLVRTRRLLRPEQSDPSKGSVGDSWSVSAGEILATPRERRRPSVRLPRGGLIGQAYSDAYSTIA